MKVSEVVQKIIENSAKVGIKAAGIAVLGPLWPIAAVVVEPVALALIDPAASAIKDAATTSQEKLDEAIGKITPEEIDERIQELAASDEAVCDTVELLDALFSGLADDHWQILRNQAAMSDALAVEARLRRQRYTTLLKGAAELGHSFFALNAALASERAIQEGREPAFENLEAEYAVLLRHGGAEGAASKALFREVEYYMACLGLSAATVEIVRRTYRDDLARAYETCRTAISAQLHPIVRLGFLLGFAASHPERDQSASALSEMAREFHAEAIVADYLEKVQGWNDPNLVRESLASLASRLAHVA